MKKLLAVLMVAVLALAAVACGSKVKGTEESWGHFSKVFVPEGYVFHGGVITGADDEDPEQCYMLPEEGNVLYDYFWIIEKDDVQNTIDNVNLIRDNNNGEDITIKAGDIEWTGTKYVASTLSGDLDCGSVYAIINDEPVMVNFVGHSADSAELIAILESIQIAD